MYAVIRIRGLKNIRPEIKHTLDSLQLDRKNHCVLVTKNVTMDGMLHVVKDYVAFGPVKDETVAKLLEKRGRLSGDIKISPDFLKKHNVANVQGLAQQVTSGKTTLKDIGIKPVFRLNSPKKGFGKEGIKRGVGLKGPLGFHDKGIDSLLGQMM